jgi:hypothetical protein
MNDGNVLTGAAAEEEACRPSIFRLHAVHGLHFFTHSVLKYFKSLSVAFDVIG